MVPYKFFPGSPRALVVALSDFLSEAVMGQVLAIARIAQGLVPLHSTLHQSLQNSAYMWAWIPSRDAPHEYPSQDQSVIFHSWS